MGIRVVLWCSGCRLKCKNCHNPQTWDFSSGKPFDITAKAELFEALNKPYIQGLTFSGGHPFEPENIDEVISLAKEIKEKLPEKDIWLYTGYTFEEIVNCNGLKYIDIIIDGPYIDEQRDLTLKFCGSRNQRLIDVQQTLTRGEITLWNG